MAKEESFETLMNRMISQLFVQSDGRSTAIVTIVGDGNVPVLRLDFDHRQLKAVRGHDHHLGTESIYRRL